MEATPEQVLASLQNIFLVSLPGSAQSAQTPPPRTEVEPPSLGSGTGPKNLLRLDTTAQLLTSRNPGTQVDYTELISDILMEVLTGMSQNDIYPSGISKKTLEGLEDWLLAYLFQSWARVGEEERNNKKRSAVPPLSEVLVISRAQILLYASLSLQNVFAVGPKYTSLPFSPLKKPLVEQTIPSGFLVDLVQTTAGDWDTFKMVSFQA